MYRKLFSLLLVIFLVGCRGQDIVSGSDGEKKKIGVVYSSEGKSFGENNRLVTDILNKKEIKEKYQVYEIENFTVSEFAEDVRFLIEEESVKTVVIVELPPGKIFETIVAKYQDVKFISIIEPCEDCKTSEMLDLNKISIIDNDYSRTNSIRSKLAPSKVKCLGVSTSPDLGYLSASLVNNLGYSAMIYSAGSCDIGIKKYGKEKLALELEEDKTVYGKNYVNRLLELLKN